MSKKLSRGPVIALASVLVLGAAGGGTAAAIALDKDTVTISTDGSSKTVTTRANNVAGLLKQEGIALGQHDVIQPSLDTKLQEGTDVSIQIGKPITLTIDGKKVTRWTTATTLAKALDQFQLDDPANLLSTNRSTTIGRDGLNVTVTTPKTVTITTAKGTKSVEVPGNATVADALKAAGIKAEAIDKINPGVNAPVTKDMTVDYKDVHHRPVVVKTQIPFEVKEKDDPELLKGERKVITKGVKGEKQTTVLQVRLDGKLVSNWRKVSEKVARKPVTEVVAVGTKEPKPETTNNEPDTDSTTTTKKTTTTSKTTSSTPKSTPTQDTNVPAKSGGYSGSCEASNYWDPQPVASGGMFNPWAMTTAHKTLPFGTRLKVTNVANGKSVIVTVNDRGPYVGGRCLDLSKGAFLKIASESAGVAQVTYVQV